MNDLKLTILGTPTSKQSFRFAVAGKKVFRYQSKEIKQSANDIRQQIIAQLPPDFKPFTKGVWIKLLLFVFPIPKNLNKTQQKLADEGNLVKTTRPDLHDNLCKGLMDAMEGIVFLNDSQICAMDKVVKLYGPIPKIEIVLEEIGGSDEDIMPHMRR